MVLTRGLLELFRSCWLDGTGVHWTDPRVNLLKADLRDLPPIAVFYGTDELLSDEAMQFALRAEAAGNNQYLRSVQGGQHSFIMGAGRVPEVDDAITEMGKWLRRKLLLRAAP
jgi:monoterpene epsilon-lactone hydrolase